MWLRRTISDGSVLDVHGPPDGHLEGVRVVGDLPDVLDVPPVGLESLRHVVGVGERGGPVDADVIVVVHVDETAEAQVAGQGRRLVGNALLEVPVAADHEGVVVAQLRTEPRPQQPLRDPHAHPVGEALPEWPGRDLDPRGPLALGMARGERSPLPELLEVLEGQPESGQEEHGVLEDAGVPGREHEAIAIRPVGVTRVEAHDAGPQHVSERRERHRRARVARRWPAGGRPWPAPV